jgi:hypothetical protein
VLITAKGPSLSAYGLSSVLANPRLAVYDSAGRQIAVNDDVGTPAAGSDLAITPGVPTNPLESAMALVLPPGNYTAIVSGNGGTGIALLEITDMRNGGLRATASTLEESLVMNLRRAREAKEPKGAKPAIELCTSTLPLAVVAR